jgi:hypothetical protein
MNAGTPMIDALVTSCPDCASLVLAVDHPDGRVLVLDPTMSIALEVYCSSPEGCGDQSFRIAPEVRPHRCPCAGKVAAPAA